MGGRIRRFLQRRRLRKVQEHWTRVADAAPTMDRTALKAWQSRATTMRREINRVIHAISARQATAMAKRAMPAAPLGTDWSWRPDLWLGPVPSRWTEAREMRTSLSSDVELHHDCSLREIVVRQTRGENYGLSLDIYGFAGSFVSVTLILPDAVASGFKPRHLVRVETVIDCERPIKAYVRLSIKHGPNTEQLVHELADGARHQLVEFDLAYARFDDKRVERAWLDLIFDRPAMNAIRLSDMVVSRRPRAEL